jgi:hypothetical protein
MNSFVLWSHSNIVAAPEGIKTASNSTQLCEKRQVYYGQLTLSCTRSLQRRARSERSCKSITDVISAIFRLDTGLESIPGGFGAPDEPLSAFRPEVQGSAVHRQTIS